MKLVLIQYPDDIRIKFRSVFNFFGHKQDQVICFKAVEI